MEEALCGNRTSLARPGSDAEEGKVLHHLLSESGGPVLVVPDSAQACPGSARVAIAWNGRRESARAVRDAMPLLEAAGAANVVMVKPRTETQTSAKRLLTMLRAHGIDCDDVQERGSDLRPGDALISRAEDMGADVLVMGAFGRSRLNEVITGGGTTRRVLEQATVPLLMAQ
jgi:nucleotide-binding universal stress UspA family protein